MKPETLIFDKVRSIIPDGSSKTVFFASVTETSYEVFCSKHSQCLSAGPQRQRQDRSGRESALYDRRHRPHGQGFGRKYGL